MPHMSQNRNGDKMFLTAETERAYPVPDNTSAVGAQRLPGGHLKPSPNDPSVSDLSPNARTLTETVRLLDVCGKFVRMVGAEEAHALIRQRKATGLGSKRRISAVQLTVQATPQEPTSKLLPNGLVGQRYSDNHEHEDNPPEVWRLKRLSAKDPKTDLHMHLCYIASLTDCMGPADKADLKRELAVMHGLKRKDFD